MAAPGASERVFSIHALDEDAVRARYASALAAGGAGIHEPAQQPWNTFTARVEDPDGHLWMTLVRPPVWAG